MKIALLGYGKMGKIIEKIALDRKHEIVLTIDIDNKHDLNADNLKKADVAIDFSIPESAFDNIMICFDAGVPIVSGTTGWMDNYKTVTETCLKKGKTFFYASNYSLGVNILFRINKQLAKIMNAFPAYDANIEETHHIHKLDAPSGTAITLAEGILENLHRKKSWALDQKDAEDVLNITAYREGEVPGIHVITYDSEVDYIQLKHSAKSRKGFAFGAVLAAEYIKGKTGIFTMEDLLNLK
ncbi:MAG: 4-hydroxy-tetrahydrodipicolinate reductase [Bacteroidales bacterium]|nr:4-hydroxy-tetrahydrodipicolinate reductase [Bacteroidales bacterium]